MIEISGVSKVFTGRKGTSITALGKVDLAIEENQFISLVGPSGCGKSTLLRLVGGLIPPTSGTIRIRNKLVTAPLQDIGIVFQSPVLLPWASIYDNVVFPAKIMKVLDEAMRRRAHELLELVGLKDFKNSYPHELSGGMKMRASIARSLVHDPSLLLMDEPFGALDALTRDELTLELLNIWQNNPKTILFVTHSIPEAVLLSGKVVVMSARPARIDTIRNIDLPYPRDLEMEQSDEFKHATRDIRELIYKKQAA